MSRIFLGIWSNNPGRKFMFQINTKIPDQLNHNHKKQNHSLETRTVCTVLCIILKFTGRPEQNHILEARTVCTALCIILKFIGRPETPRINFLKYGLV